MTGHITFRENLNEERIEWRIVYYFNKYNLSIGSPLFEVKNCSFGLVLHPRKAGYLSMKLSSRNCFEIKTEFCMGIKKEDGTELKTNVKEYVLSPLSTTPSIKIISATLLLRSRDVMVPNDCLTVFCNFYRIENMGDSLNNFPAINSPFRDTEKEKSANLSPDSSVQRGYIRKSTSEDSCAREAISVLTKNFKDLYLNKTDADVTIKVKNKTYPAHKLILIARSEVFASMFQHDTSEKRSGIIDITDCDPESFDDFLLFLYTADINIVSSKNAIGLYKTSDKYGCDELLKECVRFMIRNLTVDTFCDYFELVTMHDESDLLIALTNFFVKNAKAIFPTTKWLNLLESYPALCNELLIKFSNTGK